LVGGECGGSRDMGVEGMGESIKATRKVFKMGIRSRRENPGVYGKGGKKREKMMTRMGRRAIGYEEKLERGEGSKWARKCWKDIKRRGRRGVEMGGTEEGI